MMLSQTLRAIFALQLIAVVGTANAQTSHLPASTHASPPANSVLWTKADTGRMMPGDRTFTRHTPGMCVAVLESVRRAIWRRHEWDTTERINGLDTLPTAAIQAGRACAAQFDETDTSDVHLRDLMRLRTFLGDRSGARAATTKRLSRVSSDTARGTILFDVVKAELQTPPVHMPSVYAALEQLDSLGNGAVFTRLLAHDLVAKYTLHRLFDTTAVQHEARAIWTIRPLLTSAELDEFSGFFLGIYAREWYIAWYRVQDSTLPLTIDSIAQAGFRNIGALADGQVGDLIKRWGQVLVPFASLVGLPAPSLTGAYWYNKPTGVTYPEPGKVTLLYEVNDDIQQREMRLVNLEYLRRMYEKYYSRGLRVVLLTKTDGASWESPKQSAVDEANTIAWFLLEQLRLPFSVLVDTPHVENEQLEPRTEYERAYASPKRGVTVLVGRDGKVRTMTIGAPGDSESITEAFIVQALEKK